jgi:uncharacterized protein YecE (DUF72 family)
MAVEFRHGSWLNEHNREQTLDFLLRNDIAHVCIDGPQGFASSVPALPETTSEVGVVRFHGRNAETWEKKGLTTAERFNYLYSEDELREWRPAIEKMAERTKQLHVLFNNCHEDKAVRNARQMRMVLD